MSALDRLQSRISQLEVEVASRVLENDYGVMRHAMGTTEVHVIAYATPNDSYLVITRNGLQLADGEIDHGTVEELVDALGVYRVEIYAGQNLDDEDYPTCGCRLIGSASRRDLEGASR